MQSYFSDNLDTVIHKKGIEICTSRVSLVELLCSSIRYMCTKNYNTVLRSTHSIVFNNYMMGKKRKVEKNRWWVKALLDVNKLVPVKRLTAFFLVSQVPVFHNEICKKISSYGLKVKKEGTRCKVMQDSSS
jgi:hypothetical protein